MITGSDLQATSRPGPMGAPLPAGPSRSGPSSADPSVRAEDSFRAGNSRQAGRRLGDRRLGDRRPAARRRTMIGTGVGIAGLVAALVLVVAVGSSSAGTSGPGSRAAIPAGLTVPSSSAVRYVPPGLVINRLFPVETKSVRDFTFIGGPEAQITARTDRGLRAALSTGLIALANVRCWDAHLWNPTSDHPLGKACDMFQHYQSAAGVSVGWKLADWLVANQAKLGINYVIWQDYIWTAGSANWGLYYSAVYGCPDPTNISGCHMDHIHVSFY